MDTQKVVSKLMISYIAVWIPILIICLIVSETSLNRLREKEEREIEEQIYQVPMDIVKQYQGYFENAVAMSKTDELDPQKFMANEMNRYLGKQYLKEIFDFNVGMYEILLYYDQNELYSVQGTASLPVYFRRVMFCTEEGYLQACEMLESDTGGIYYLESEQGGGYLCYYVPIIKKAQSKMSITFVYSFETVIEAVELRSGNKISKFCFSVENSTVFWERVGDELVLRRTDLILDLDEMKEIIVPIGYETNKEIKVYYELDDIIKDLSQVQKTHYILICVGVLIAVLSTAWMSRRKAIQIRSLEEAFDVSSEEPDLRDEYQYLRTLIRNMARKSEAFLKNEAVYKRLLLQQNAKLLFQGAWKIGKI